MRIESNIGLLGLVGVKVSDRVFFLKFSNLVSSARFVNKIFFAIFGVSSVLVQYFQKGMLTKIIDNKIIIIIKYYKEGK